MNYNEILLNTVLAVTMISWFATIILGTVFALKHRERRQRWLPTSFALVVMILGMQPEAGSDVRGHWIGAALALAWSIWMIYFAIRLRQWSEGGLLGTLRIAFFTVSVGYMILCTVVVAESWAFFHSIRRVHQG